MSDGKGDDVDPGGKPVTLTGYEGDTLKLAANQIPTVGTKPNDTYKAGSWDVTPSTDTAITAATTYTYTYAAKEASVVTKAPEAKTLTYTGSAQELVTAGEATGGEMQYALGDANGATQPYTTSIPAKTDAGTYYVWYKVVGDANHNGTEPNSVEAKINPVDKTDLNTAIEEAEAYYESIKEDDVYAQVAEALKKAIDEAKKYTNDNVAEKEVKEAIDTIKAAKVDAEEGKKEADDTVVANEVADAINALPDGDEVEVTDKEKIEAARKAYDALTDDQKAKVSADTLKKLEDAEKALEDAVQKEAEKEAADTEAAKNVTDAINALPASDKVATTDKAAIEAARKAYDALTEDQKAKVPAETLKKLEDAEKALADAEKNTSDDDKKDEDKPDYKNEWVDGQWYGADGNTDYEGKGTWKSNETGWWYEDTTGWYPVSQWQKIDGKWYYFDAAGYMASNEWVDGYWLSGNGAWEYEYIGSWKTNGTDWWYEDESGWYPVSQWQKIDGKWYYFGNDGIMATDQYVGDYWVGSDGSWQ
jgi:glucan-binding YG repeat protein